MALQENTLTFTYKMGGKCRFMKEEQYNKKIAGLSLAGKVERTEQENIYLKLDIDGSTGKAIYPYPWKPVAGNLMYCMPQIGTKVYLYFPNYYEENAIAVNSVHVRRHIVGGKNCTLISVSTPPRPCRTGTRRRLSAA